MLSCNIKYWFMASANSFQSITETCTITSELSAILLELRLYTVDGDGTKIERWMWVMLKVQFWLQQKLAWTFCPNTRKSYIIWLMVPICWCFVLGIRLFSSTQAQVRDGSRQYYWARCCECSLHQTLPLNCLLFCLKQMSRYHICGNIFIRHGSGHRNIRFLLDSWLS